MAPKGKKNPWTRVKKTKEMAEVFKRKSGPIVKHKNRKTQKQEWQNEVEKGAYYYGYKTI